MIPVVYVDDVLVFTHTELEMDSIIDSLRERKQNFTLGTDVFIFLGVEVISNDNWENITLLQKWLIKKVIEKIGMKECNTKDTKTGNILEQIYMDLRWKINWIFLQLMLC